MTTLNDTQRVLLASAAQRDDASLYPLPERLKAGARVTKAVAALLAAGMAAERETSDAATVFRSDGDQRYGVYATVAGLAAFGVTGERGGAGESDTPAPAAGPAPAAPPRETKAAAVTALLQREGGATLAELIAATGWLPHTTRAALTGLRKKGQAIERDKRDDATCYRIVEAA